MDHLFLTLGHTILPNSTDFDQKRVRKASTTVYVPEDWFEVLQTANLRKSFIVQEMTKSDFFYYKSYVESLYG